MEGRTDNGHAQKDMLVLVTNINNVATQLFNQTLSRRFFFFSFFLSVFKLYNLNLYLRLREEIKNFHGGGGCACCPSFLSSVSLARFFCHQKAYISFSQFKKKIIPCAKGKKKVFF